MIGGGDQRRAVAPATHELGGQSLLGISGREMRKQLWPLAAEEGGEAGDVLVDPSKRRVRATAHEVSGGAGARRRAVLGCGVSQDEGPEVDLTGGSSRLVPADVGVRDPVGVTEV